MRPRRSCSEKAARLASSRTRPAIAGWRGSSSSTSIERVSDQLLGRQRAHWSFFTDSDGSVMEGNEIEDLGGGVFRTASATEKYSRLDLYAMGLATEAEVPRWFYVDAPISSRDRESGPVAGSFINGTRRDVLIQDVIDALGPRLPSAADAPRAAPPGLYLCQARQRHARSAGSHAARPHPRAVRSVLQSRHREPDDGAHHARAVGDRVLRAPDRDQEPAIDGFADDD